MNISSLGIFFGVLLAALPVFIIIRFRLNLTRRFLMSLVRMVVATGLLAALMTLATWACRSPSSMPTAIAPSSMPPCSLNA